MLTCSVLESFLRRETPRNNNTPHLLLADSMLARGVRNVIYNYTDAQRKVRSATSNDAWGPSPALMHEISDLTDNVVAYAEIMPSRLVFEALLSTHSCVFL